MKKYGIAALLAAFVLVISQSVSGSSMLKSAEFAPETTLQVFGRTVQTDIIAAEKRGVKGVSNYVSARDLAEQLGYQVKYDSKNKTISVGLYPRYGVEASGDKLEEIKNQFKPRTDKLKNQYSTRMLDSFEKELAYSAQLVDGDPVLLALLIAEDYKGFRDGSESAFDYIWKSLDAE